jgi:S1-C subfamily serine protease
MKLPAQQKGVLVVDVIPNSPADKAGLQGSEETQTLDGLPVRVGGDVITQINGQPLSGIDDLIAYLASSTSVGQDVKLTVLRGGAEKIIDVNLAARPSADVRSQQQASQGISLGILGMDMSADIAAEMNLPADQTGVLIVEVQPGSLADQIGLRGSDQPVTLQGESLMVGGDVITAVNQQVVRTTQELKAMLADLQTGSALNLTILRDGAQIQISLNSGG